MMMLRRMLMTMGGGPVAVGDFTKYEKKTATFPNAADSSTWETGANVPCSFEPKLVVFYGGTETAGNIVNGVFALFDNVAVGGIEGRNSSGGTARYIYFNNTSLGAGRYKYDSGVFSAQRAATGVYWSNADTYTFEFYG